MFQPINFANIPTQPSPYSGLLESLMKGYQLAQIPKQTQLQQQLLQAQINKAQQSDPLASQLSGVAKEAFALELLRNKYGADSEVYQNAKKAFEGNIQKTEGLNQYRASLTEAAPKRFSTTLGKTEQEINEAQQGFLPGTKGAVNLDPQQQQSLLERYELQRQKQISDLDTRKRTLFASNIDKTLDNLDVNDLTKFAGPQGALELKKEQFNSALGKPSEKYIKYQEAVTAADTLAKQVRQFYGDSITPAIQSQLQELTNPVNWIDSPEVSKARFNKFKNILNQETGTYRNALTGVKEFKSKDLNAMPNTRLKFNPSTGELE